ncbi:MAG: hypothetical protein LBQ30_10765 [Treponema sp.]|jgi:hypothetical protein|nr:hypothetical protein [Treponema sp.]
MKKNYPLLLSLTLTSLMGACASAPRPNQATDLNLPDFVRNPPVQEDMLFGIGSATDAFVNQALIIAEARARQSLAFQLNAHVQAMITDYTRTAGTEHTAASLEFAETVGRHLTQTTLQGAVPVRRQKTPDKTFWVLVAYSKADAAKFAAKIIAEEASQYAEFKAMDALSLLDRQLQRINTKPEVVNQ